ncbi:unnamed protein product [Mytilus edulis]|uniref:Uncharacterized protein n=1 Tax=Mytilus edulis TaxID=6550 RepID=A0A8S3QQ50_MYTED|nr:unnamed protein product [Mytilus edulis]
MDEVEKSQFDTDDFEHALSSSDPPTTEMKFNTHDQPKSTYVTIHLLSVSELRVKKVSCELQKSSCELRVELRVKSRCSSSARCELRVTKVELRVTKVELRVTKVELRVKKVEFRVTKVELRVTKVELRVTKVELRVTKVELRVTKVELRVTKVELRKNVETKIFNFLV